MEERERIWREAGELKWLEEKKKAEIEEDRRWRAEYKERECQRKEGGKGRAVEEMPEAGLSQPQKRRAESEGEGRSAKKLKVSDFRHENLH